MKALNDVIDIFLARLSSVASKKFTSSIAKESEELSKIISLLMVARYWDGLFEIITPAKPPKSPPDSFNIPQDPLF